MNQEVSDLKNEINDLTTAFQNLKDAESTLASCIKYSDEWYEQLDNVNQKINEILTAYPDLMEIQGIISRDDKTGLLSFDSEKISEYLEKKNNQLDLSTWAAKINELRVAEREKELT